MTNNTMTNPSTIERIVLRRIYTMRVLRVLLSNATLAILISGVALWGIGREVWVAHVLQNAPKDIREIPRFYIDAFDHTRLLVQALSVITLAGCIVLARETARSISRLVAPALS